MQRRRRLIAVLLATLTILAGVVFEALQEPSPPEPAVLSSAVVQQANDTKYTLASQALESLAVKGRAPKTGYSRAQFSPDWGQVANCSIRELVLARDFSQSTLNEDDCRVMNGTLNDPYTGKTIVFQRGPTSSQAVQIDHVVAVSDAWQKGAQQLTSDLRYQFYNDPLNLLAVDGPANQNKGDGDAATWLPLNKDFRCRYVARQIAVKLKYSLWVTTAEHDAIYKQLETCPGQVLPITQ